VGAKAPADGYHLIMTNAGAQTVSAGLYPKLPYDSIRDFAPISLVALAPNVLIVHPTLPAQSVKSLMALARSKPGELSFSSGGNGSTAHLSGEMFKLMARINIVHVPFKGAPAAALGVMTGQVALAFPNIPPALPLIRSGRLKALAVTTLKRSSALPEIPTVNESGLSGYEATAWFGVIAPAATPAYIVAKLNGMIQKMLQTRQLQERIALPPAGVNRLLDAAVAIRLLTKRENEHYALGMLGAPLVGNRALIDMIVHHGDFYRDLHDPLALLRGDISGKAAMAEYWPYINHAQCALAIVFWIRLRLQVTQRD
ncbi:MAG: hypothetical protein EBV46_07405, partial [Burkholderiaceae bacterium]|nr:hypothetical protein [Burkholderiaceae bacterium]